MNTLLLTTQPADPKNNGMLQVLPLLFVLAAFLFPTGVYAQVSFGKPEKLTKTGCFVWAMFPAHRKLILGTVDTTLALFF